MSFPTETDVVVVGAGPTGLTLACQLAHNGVDVLVVDKAPHVAETSRAAVIHARTLEVLETLDVTARLVAEAVVVSHFTVRDHQAVLARLDFTRLSTHHPYALMLPQSRTEVLLGQRLAELGGHVHRPCTATGVTFSDDGATVTVSGPDAGQRSVHTRYVVGADGMHSTVRRAAGIGFKGGRYPQSFLLADVQMHWPLPPDEVQLFFSPAGLVVVAPLPGGRHRIVATADNPPEHATTATVQALLDDRGPGRARVRNLVWSSRFQVHHRLADHYRAGPVMLAGDAAHVHSPAGGQGMNTGIQDGDDLGRTLARALRHEAPGAILDGYEERRRPIAQRVVTLTDRATRLATLTHPTARAARNTGIGLLGRLRPVCDELARRLAQLPAR